MLEIVQITYKEFLDLKAHHYSMDRLKYYACKYLCCEYDDIDDIDFWFGLTFNVYLKD